MKRAIGYLLFLLFLVSCGTDSSHFKIEGRFRNLNQGEFYVYSPDGGTNQLDTIKVQDGSFAYEVPLEKKATFIIVFPNFSEQAIFGEPGKTATVKGDASHLKEMEVSGNTDKPARRPHSPCCSAGGETPESKGYSVPRYNADKPLAAAGKPPGRGSPAHRPSS